MKKYLTNQVMVGSVPVGGGSPIVVQSMTNTDTADVEKTTEQVFELWKAGSEIVRVTVNNEASADAIPHIKNLESVYRILTKQRHARGAIEFDSSETIMIFNDQGKIDRIEPVIRRGGETILESSHIPTPQK